MWNPQAVRLMDWATDENNRVRAQKMVKWAKLKTYGKHIGNIGNGGQKERTRQ